MRRCIILFCLLIGTTPAWAQQVQAVLEAILRYESGQAHDSLHDAYMQAGHLYLADSVYAKSAGYFEQALALPNSSQAQRLACHEALAHTYARWNRPEPAIMHYLPLASHYRQQQDWEPLQEVLQRISSLYKQLNDHEGARKASLELLELGRNAGNAAAVANAFNNLGVIQREQGNGAAAVEQFKQALAADSARVLPIGQRMVILLNLGYQAAEQKRYQEALSYYQQAQEASTARGYSKGQLRAANGIATVHYLQRHFDIALEQAKQAYQTAQARKDPEELAPCCLLLSKIYEAMQDTRQSQYYYRQYLSVQEALQQEAQAREALDLQRQLDAEREERDIRLLLAEKERQGLALAQLRLEAEKRTQELAANQQQMVVLQQQQALQEQMLANQRLEQRRIALEKERIQQNLLLAQQAIAHSQQAQQIESLQKDREIAELAEKEQRQAMALLETEAAMQQQAAQQQSTLRIFLSILALLLALLLLAALFWLYQHRKSNRVLMMNKMEILKKNEMLQASEEELRQNAEELMAVNERVVEEKQKAELALLALQEAKNQMVQSEKMASLGQLTAGVAHEINNPVNFIAGGAQSLRVLMADIAALIDAYTAVDEAVSDQEKAEALARLQRVDAQIGSKAELKDDALAMLADIEKGADRVAEIVRGLRNFSRSDTDLKVPDNLHDILNNALLILSSKYKDRIEIQRLYDERIGPIECYSGQLSQVFLNIIANAVDAIDGKGTVSIETQDLGEKVRIAIQDTGPGIPQEIQAKIFDPFFTTKDVGKGTGLGLSIVHGIVEKHGGRIWVESEMGKGSIFFIEVPK